MSPAPRQSRDWVWKLTAIVVSAMVGIACTFVTVAATMVREAVKQNGDFQLQVSKDLGSLSSNVSALTDNFDRYQRQSSIDRDEQFTYRRQIDGRFAEILNRLVSLEKLRTKKDEFGGP